MSQKTQVILNTLAKVIVNINRTCISSALNQFKLDIKHAQNVDIDNLTMSATGQTQGKCDQFKTVDMNAIKTGMQKQLDDMLSVNTNDSKLIQLKTSIVESINTKIVQECSVSSTNTTGILLKNITDTVSIKNVDVDQVAAAQMTQCIQNAQVTVGTNTIQPLKDYLDYHAPWLNVKSPDGKMMTACGSVDHAKQNLTLSIVISVVLLLLVIVGIVIHHNVSTKTNNNFKSK